MVVGLSRNFFKFMKMKHTVINSKCPKKALLIHGLYANSGYWLEYLTYFKDYKLIILEIDYFTLQNIQKMIDEVNLLIDTELDGEVDIIVSHSFGTILANGIFSSTFKHSFEICPVYSSTRTGKEEFIKEIRNKLKSSKTQEETRNQLKWVDELLKIHQLNLEFKRNRVLFYPDNDIYFEYNKNFTSEIQYFKGDHFNIHDSLRLILKII